MNIRDKHVVRLMQEPRDPARLLPISNAQASLPGPTLGRGRLVFGEPDRKTAVRWRHPTAYHIESAGEVTVQSPEKEDPVWRRGGGSAESQKAI